MHPLVAYAVAVLSPGIAVALRSFFGQWAGDVAPYIFFYVAVAVTAYLGGWRPALCSFLLSGLAADFFFLPPLYKFGIASNVQLMSLAAFSIVCGVIITLIERLRRTVIAASRFSEEILQHERAARFLAAIVESSDDAIISKDLTGRITSWNHAAERLFGYSAAEIIGQPITVLIPADRLGEEARIIGGVLRGEPIAHFDTVRRTKNGTLIDVSLSVSAVRDSSGVILGASKIVRSIAERKAAERRNRIETAAIRSLNSANDSLEAACQFILAVCEHGIWQCGAFWRTDAGSQQLRCAGFWSVRTSPALQALEAESRELNFESGIGLPGRVWQTREAEWLAEIAEDHKLLRAASLKRSGLRTACAVPVQAGDRVLGVLEFFSFTPQERDDTFLQMMRGLGTQLGQYIVREQTAIALHEAQRKLRDQAARLEQTVEERTRELQQSLQDVESLCYTIAHDLRAPLRAMQGFARALVEDYADTLDSVGAHYTQRIVKAALRMDGLITDLLAYGRLGTADITPLPTELDTVVDAFLADYAEEIKARHATICVERLMPVVIANRALLGQVIANLLLNAMKFVPAGIAPEIRVYAQVHEDNVRLCIEDNGIGIAPEHRNKLFQIFQRLHGPDQYPGTGIGLAMVKKAMERMGGGVGFTSMPGKGSIFWIELPSGSAGEFAEQAGLEDSLEH